MFELDDEYVQFGQEDDDTTEVQEVQEVRVNSQGIKVRGKDMEWLPAGSFHSDERYKDSEIYKNLKEHFTLKRKSTIWCRRELCLPSFKACGLRKMSKAVPSHFP